MKDAYQWTYLCGSPCLFAKFLCLLYIVSDQKIIKDGPGFHLGIQYKQFYIKLCNGDSVYQSIMTSNFHRKNLLMVYRWLMANHKNIVDTAGLHVFITVIWNFFFLIKTFLLPIKLYLPQVQSNNSNIVIFVNSVIWCVIWVVNLRMHPRSFVARVVNLLRFPFTL